MMTAPLRIGETTTVPVALGNRAYDIAIGRGLLAELGTRIAALRPGARAAIVTDETVAEHHLEAAEAALAAAGIRAVPIVVPAGEASKSWEKFEDVCDRMIDAAHRAQRPGRRARRRRGRRPCGLRGRDPAARPRFRAGADNIAGAGRFLGRRQDRDQLAPRQESRRRVPSADPGDRRHRAARHAARARLPRRLCGGREIRTARRCRLLRLAGGELAGRVRGRQLFGSSAREHAIAIACRGKAGIVARDERETGERALLNLGHTFGHAFEAAAGFSDKLLHGEAVALGIVCAFEFSTRLGLLPTNDAGRVAHHLAAVGLPTHLRDVPAVRTTRGCADGADRAGQEGEARQAHFHPRARHRPGLRRAAMSIPRRCARSSRRRCPDEPRPQPMTSSSSICCLRSSCSPPTRSTSRRSSRWSRAAGFRINALAEENRFGARLVRRILENHRGVPRLLPARHHDGVARPRLGRRADRRGIADAGSHSARNVRGGAAFHVVPGRLPGLLVAAHRHRRAGAEDAGDPRAGAGLALGRLPAARFLSCCSIR